MRTSTDPGIDGPDSYPHSRSTGSKSNSIGAQKREDLKEDAPRKLNAGTSQGSSQEEEIECQRSVQCSGRHLTLWSKKATPSTIGVQICANKDAKQEPHKVSCNDWRARGSLQNRTGNGTEAPKGPFFSVLLCILFDASNAFPRTRRFSRTRD